MLKYLVTEITLTKNFNYTWTTSQLQ